MTRLFVLLPICLLLQDRQALLTDAPRAVPPARPTAQKSDDDIAHLLRTDPAAFLQKSLDRYERQVHGYSCLLCKRERVNGTLRAAEEVHVHFKERPHSVYMHWHKGAGLCQKALFVKGENNDCLLAKPAGLLSFIGVQSRRLDHPDSRNSARLLISEFGIKLATRQTLDDMLKAKKAGTLRMRYEGEAATPQLDNRRCYKLVRTISPAEYEGVSQAVLFLDAETWLQTGAILTDADGNLVAEYFFKDMRINPVFAADQFTQAAL